MLNEQKVEDYSPYCDVCTGCGEEGCCSPLGCQMSPDGKYCQGYLTDLKFTYSLFEILIKEIYKEEEKYKELLEIYNAAHHTQFEYWYLKKKNDDTTISEN